MDETPHTRPAGGNEYVRRSLHIDVKALLIESVILGLRFVAGGDRQVNDGVDPLHGRLNVAGPRDIAGDKPRITGNRLHVCEPQFVVVFKRSRQLSADQSCRADASWLNLTDPPLGTGGLCCVPEQA